MNNKWQFPIAILTSPEGKILWFFEGSHGKNQALRAWRLQSSEALNFDATP
jgi:hypothetical protein